MPTYTAKDRTMKICAKMKISFTALAVRCGTSPQNLSQKLKNDNPDPEVILMVAKVLGVDCAEIYPEGELVAAFRSGDIKRARRLLDKNKD